MFKNKNIKKISYVIAGLAAAIIVSFSGFLNHNKNTPLSKSDSPPSLQIESFKNNELIISKPSNGPIVKVVEINLIKDKDGNTSAITDADNIAVNQDIILYDTTNNILPYGGKIKEIEKKEDKSIINIIIPPEIEKDSLSPNAKIITSETISSQRFPLSALQHDKNGNTFVWLVENTDKENAYKAIMTWVDGPFIGENYFEAGKPINASNKIVLNSNVNLKNNEIYKMTETTFTAPNNSPIKQALYDYNSNIIKKSMEEEAQKAIDCQNKPRNIQQTNDITSNSNCNSSKIPESSAEQLFNTILNRMPPGAAK